MVEAVISDLSICYEKDRHYFGMAIGQCAGLVERNGPDQSGPFKCDRIPNNHPVS